MIENTFMHPPAFPHDPIVELFEDVYLLHGSIRMGPGMRMNRNMLILRQDGELTLVNPVRMSEEGLKSLEALGKVARVIRLGDFHGLDDRFYLERYRARFWCQPGQGSYKEPKGDVVFNSATEFPVRGASFFVYENARFPEAAILIPQHRLLITTDSLQYYNDFSYFSGFTKIAFRLLGFKPGLNIGGPWVKRVTPKGGSLKPDFERLLTLDFDAIIGAHGGLLKSGAKDHLRAEMQVAFS